MRKTKLINVKPWRASYIGKPIRARRMRVRKARGDRWLIYIPDEGHWPIDYAGEDEAGARRAYLKWAQRKRLPAGSFICRGIADCAAAWGGNNEKEAAS